MQLLRGFHARMEEIVFSRSGTLDKFIGDALLVTFGVPDPPPDDAVRALEGQLAFVLLPEFLVEPGRDTANAIHCLPSREIEDHLDAFGNALNSLAAGLELPIRRQPLLVRERPSADAIQPQGTGPRKRQASFDHLRSDDHYLFAALGQ